MLRFTYPTNLELREIEQDLLPVLTLNDPLFEHFPIATVNEDLLAWESSDNFIGLQSARGLNGDPVRVRNVGGRRWVMEPGYYGEFATIDEIELTRRRPLGAFAGTVDITDLVRKRQDQLLSREITRIRQIGWTLLTAGTFAVLNERGAVVHTDSYRTQVFNALVAWAVPANATPLANFRAVQLLSRGSSVNFGAGAKAYMNRTTFSLLVSNTNPNDIAGRRVTGLLSPLNLEEINRILLGEGLPEVVVHDDGYFDDAGAWQQFIPNNVVVVIGRRTSGSRVGEYRMTRNANNPDFGPGSYVNVVDSIDTGNPVPRKIDVHRGHNGGPVLYHPNAIVVMNV